MSETIDDQPLQTSEAFRPSLQDLANGRSTRLKRLLPGWAKSAIARFYWLGYDARDFLTEIVGWLPSHAARVLSYRHLLRVTVGQHTSIHRNCRLYRPSGVRIGAYTVVNRDVL